MTRAISCTAMQIFHPQGGGQPADIGTITGDEWRFAVEHVVTGKSGSIEHIGMFTTESIPKPGSVAQLSIDETTRRLHARLHSAGCASSLYLAPWHPKSIWKTPGISHKLTLLLNRRHLLDSALTNLKRTDLIPSKGYHFQAGPYVEVIANRNAQHEVLCFPVSFRQLSY